MGVVWYGCRGENMVGVSVWYWVWVGSGGRYCGVG